MAQQVETEAEVLARLAREKEYHNKAFAEDIRKSVDKYYDTITLSRARYYSLIHADAKGKRLLEYGCGPGSKAFDLAASGAEITGIDISDVAIQIAADEAKTRGVVAEFKVMNAEVLEYPNQYFDRIIGSAIIHHLDLHKAYAEIARCLKKEGNAVFIEPLGHNPIINLYRKLTPKLRTEDEHPLKVEDIYLAKNYFEVVDVRYFHLFSIASVVFRNTFLFKPVLNALDGLDALLFKVFPFLKKNSWMSVIELKAPKH